MYSKHFNENVVVKIPPGFNFDLLCVGLVNGMIEFDHSQMRSLIFYSDFHPLSIRNKSFILQLIKQFYIYHRLKGGVIYDFLESEYIVWLDNKPILQGKVKVC